MSLPLIVGASCILLIWLQCRLYEKQTGSVREAFNEGYNHGVDHGREQVLGQYHELIMAVENKYEGETRHQTALRYIQACERTSESADQEKRP